MELSIETESPFRRDEPVSGSCKWIWIIACSGAAWFLFITVRAFILGLAFKHPVMMLVMWTMQVWMISVVFRAAWESSKCKIDRTFDVMARALRAQKRFWGMVVIAGSLTLMGLLILIGNLSKTVRMLEDIAAKRGAEAMNNETVAPE